MWKSEDVKTCTYLLWQIGRSDNSRPAGPCEEDHVCVKHAAGPALLTHVPCLILDFTACSSGTELSASSECLGYQTLWLRFGGRVPTCKSFLAMNRLHYLNIKKRTYMTFSWLNHIIQEKCYYSHHVHTKWRNHPFWIAAQMRILKIYKHYIQYIIIFFIMKVLLSSAYDQLSAECCW